MERIDFINVERIQWCCNDAGVSIEDLALETGVSQDSILKTITENIGLTFNQLKKIADYFGRGIFFFLEEGDIPENTIHSIEFRSLANQKPNISMQVRKLIERVEFQRDRYLSLIEDLGYEKTEYFLPPKLSTDIKTAAKQTRQWLGVPNKNDFDSYRQSVENKGILVFQSNGYKGKWQIPKSSPILGFSLYHKSCPVIVVKKLDSPTRQVFTLIHELAHLLIHKESTIDDEDDLNSYKGHEYEANYFAGLLLVPNAFLKEIDISMIPDDVSLYTEWLTPQKNKWGVSIEVILRRLSDENLISAKNYKLYREWLNNQVFPKGSGGNRQYRHREPKHIFGKRYVKTVFDAKNSSQLSLAKVSSYLDNIKIKDLHELEKHLADY